MGDRANIRWQDDAGGVIHFYTHWTGSDLPQTLAAALDRARDRWDDDPYLARAVFCEMVAHDASGTTGFGISTYIGDGRKRVLTVDTRSKTVKDFEGAVWSYGDFIARARRGDHRE